MTPSHADSLVQTDPVAHAERQVEEALDELVAIGVLQTGNRMDIESLLNPAGESPVLTGNLRGRYRCNHGT
jgi:hypothetical protein